eukprot:351792-Chlamydomonas_euryale.AAC.1
MQTGHEIGGRRGMGWDAHGACSVGMECPVFQASTQIPKKSANCIYATLCIYVENCALLWTLYIAPGAMHWTLSIVRCIGRCKLCWPHGYGSGAGNFGGGGYGSGAVALAEAAFSKSCNIQGRQRTRSAEAVARFEAGSGHIQRLWQHSKLAADTCSGGSAQVGAWQRTHSVVAVARFEAGSKH